MGTRSLTWEGFPEGAMAECGEQVGLSSGEKGEGLSEFREAEKSRPSGGGEISDPSG